MLKIFFCLTQISKCDTCFYTHFSRAFQKYSFQICNFSHKLFNVLYPTLCVKKKFTKESFKLLVMKSKNFTVIVSKMRVLGQKNQRGGALLSHLEDMLQLTDPTYNVFTDHSLLSVHLEDMLQTQHTTFSLIMHC